VNRKHIIAGGLAGALAASTGASAVFADWCADDPAIQIAGKTVYLTDYADQAYAIDLQAVQYRVLYTHRDKAGQLHVTLLVYVPSHPTGEDFDTRYVVSTGPNGSGNVLAQGKGHSGRVVIVQFVLPN